ncbi:MAG: DUF485 domain-containing protein [Actinophytocola sp.]|uniref:DUF485 domain-containing protein n=1 Tax=Actinophytocola sp. TaxID=1872138 RepID=UPI003D6C1578
MKSPVDWATLESLSELRELVARRRRYRWTLNSAWIAGTAGYLLLMTFGRDLLGASVLGAVNVSFLVVVLAQLLAFTLVASYARKSNRVFEAMEDRARLRFAQATASQVGKGES